MLDTAGKTGRRLIPKKEVLKRYPVSQATLDKRVASGKFPSPVILGDRSVAWYNWPAWKAQSLSCRKLIEFLEITTPVGQSVGQTPKPAKSAGFLRHWVG